MTNINYFEIDFKDKINLIWKILKTKGFSKDYTILELLKDNF